MLAQTLIIAGALVLGLLGALHLAYTFFTAKLDPRDAATVAAMKATSLVLTRQTSVWNAWIGFNGSHSLGVILFAAVYLMLGSAHMSLLRESPALLWLAVLGSLGYLALAKRYWFRIPLVGIATATACFVGAAIALAV